MTPPLLDADVVAVRLRSLRELLRDLGTVGPLDADRLQDDRLLRHAVERILTQLVDLAVDVNSHVAAARLGRAPVDGASSFADAATAGLIRPATADALVRSVGLRNVLVHEYVRVDLARVAAAVPLAAEQYAAYVREAAASLPALAAEARRP